MPPRPKTTKPKAKPADPRLDPASERFDPLAVKQEEAAQPATDAAAVRKDERAAEEELPKVAHRVFINAFTSGQRASMDAFPVHEIPLLRRKVEAFGETLTLGLDWPEYVPRERGLTAPQMREEYTRLKDKYTFLGNDGQPYDLVTDVYGSQVQGRLFQVMRKQERAWRELSKKGSPLTLEDWNDIVKIADPESDFIDTDIPVEA